MPLSIAPRSAGADAVKFQTHIAAAESTVRRALAGEVQQQDETRFDYWKRMEFSPEQWAGLKAHAEEKELVFLSSPFSWRLLSFLRKLGMSPGKWRLANSPTCR